MSHLRSVLIVWSVVSCRADTAEPVRPGIEVLATDSVHLLEGRRVGVLTNQTGIDRHGRDAVARLLEAGVQVTAILSPEHGYRGFVDDEHVGHGVDSVTGLPIYSLYGTVRAPTAEMLEQVDVIVADLQDIGARPYTYISTILLTMRAARLHGIPVLVADRPNPIGGTMVQGPVLDTTLSSYVGMLPVALRHGMTMGELARFGNTALGIDAALTVIPVDGWRRSQWFDDTGLPWVRPSPSMPDLESATHYPGTVLFEATNLSVGRGTPVAFQVIGAPWLDPGRVIAGAGPQPGVALSDTTVIPTNPPDGRFSGVAVRAIKFRVTDRAQYDPVRASLELLAALGRTHPDDLRIDEERMGRLSGVRSVAALARPGSDVEAVAAGWEGDLARFLGARQSVLLYP
jgi:uncharacterized protein YbbC (DUF1343 family)